MVEQQFLQRSLFDQQNLAEIGSPEFPGERLIVCFNPLLAEERTRKRQALLEATEKDLEKLPMQVLWRTKTPLSAAEIGRKVGRIIDRFKVAKHFEIAIADGQFNYQRRAEAIQREAELDGIYVIRTSEPEPSLSAEDTVRSYKNLARVERAFRTPKGIDLQIRPIYHRAEDRVRAHILICPLAHLVEWHLREAWAPLLFDDEELPSGRQTRDPAPRQNPPRPLNKRNRRD